jgi:hypothetical protein
MWKLFPNDSFPLGTIDPNIFVLKEDLRFKQVEELKHVAQAELFDREILDNGIPQPDFYDFMGF